MVLLGATNATCRPPNGMPVSVPGTIMHDGVERTFRVYVPDKAGPLPVVFVLHGLHGDGRGIERYTQFTALAASEGFIAVNPDGLDGKWNDRFGMGGKLQTLRDAQGTDDVGFISALLDYLEATYDVDAARVYITGASNGGMMTNRLACELGERLAAVAPVIADIPGLVEQNCDSAKAMPILMINSVNDPLVPYSGDKARRPRLKGLVPNALATVDFWVRHNGCPPPPTDVELPDADPNDGTRITRRTYATGASGAEVIFYSVQGGGHTWPGAPIQYLPVGLVGVTSQDMNATETIWAFFQTQHL
jgi:polyhydroxybutyrate depolymerase